MGTTRVPPRPKRWSFSPPTPSKESPRGDEQDAVQLVFLRGFYAENDSDQFVVFSSTDDLTGCSCPSCGAHEARADSIDDKVGKKNTGKGAPFQVNCTSSESPSKTVQDDGLGLQFHARFLFFLASDFSDGECRSRCPPTSWRAPTTQKSAVSEQNWPPKRPQACRASKTTSDRVSNTQKHAHLGHKRGREEVDRSGDAEDRGDHPTTTKGEEAEEESSVRRMTTTDRSFPGLSWARFCTKTTDFCCRRLRKGYRRPSRRFLR